MNERVTLLLDGKQVMKTKDEYQSIEKKTWNEYIDNNSEEYAKLINYYQVHLVSIVIGKLRNQYQTEEQKKEIERVCFSNLHVAYDRAMKKGHEAAFQWLAELSLPIDVELFKEESFKNTIMLQYQNSLSDADVIPNTIRQDTNEALFSYLDKYCENIYGPYIDTNEVLFFKGFNQAVIDIQHYYNIPEDEEVLSTLTKLPATKDVPMTPALRGRYMYGSTNTEMWGLKWDIAYNRFDYNIHSPIVYDKLIMVVNIWKTNLEIVKNNAALHVQTDEEVLEVLKKRHIQQGKTDKETPILILEYMFLPEIDDNHPNNNGKQNRVSSLVKDAYTTLNKLKSNKKISQLDVDRLDQSIKELNYTLTSPKQMMRKERAEFEKDLKKKFTTLLNVFPSNCVVIYDN